MDKNLIKLNMKLVLICVFSFCFSLVFAQQTDLLIPVNIQKAIQKGTRGVDGKPGPKYFQNRTDYTINANFDPRTGLLKGDEIVTYKNNSSDTLSFLILRLYQNFYKPEAIRQMEIDPEDINTEVKIQQIFINNIEVSIERTKNIGTNILVPLPSKLIPNTELEMHVTWEINLPNKTQIRMGRYDTTSYFVAYWYPQIAVYDDISGWCFEPYNGLYEFYNEYGNFDVKLSLLKDMLVWATGELQNSGELFSSDILGKISLAKTVDSVVRIITPDDYYNKRVLRTDAATTWHFVAENVSDFAFGVSDHYIWDGTSVEVDHKTKRRAMANHVYNIDSKLGEEVAAIARRTIESLSNDLIGVPYPYPHNTVWEGHDGTEHPMMCNDGPTEDKASKVFVTSHEIAHSYFPFMVGTNEILYAWIDEGLVTFIPKEIEIEYGNNNAHYYINAYGKRSMGTNSDISLMGPSTNMNLTTYFMQNYGRAAIGFYYLHDMLGNEMFTKVLKEFIYTWESKHPTPTDLALTFNSITGEDWGWYWNAWFYDSGYADLALSNVKINNNKLDLSVENKGRYPVPIKIKITFADNTSELIYQTALVWKDKSKWSLKKKFDKSIVKIELGDINIPDAFELDNIFIVK